jgi:hypothetical protein
LSINPWLNDWLINKTPQPTSPPSEDDYIEYEQPRRITVTKPLNGPPQVDINNNSNNKSKILNKHQLQNHKQVDNLNRKPVNTNNSGKLFSRFDTDNTYQQRNQSPQPKIQQNEQPQDHQQPQQVKKFIENPNAVQIREYRLVENE